MFVSSRFLHTNLKSVHEFFCHSATIDLFGSNNPLSFISSRQVPRPAPGSTQPSCSLQISSITCSILFASFSVKLESKTSFLYRSQASLYGFRGQGPRAVVKLRSAEVGEKYPTKIATQAPTGEDWTSDISQGQQAVNLFVVSSDRRYGKFTLQVYTSNTLTETTAITVTEATNE